MSGEALREQYGTQVCSQTFCPPWDTKEVSRSSKKCFTVGGRIVMHPKWSFAGHHSRTNRHRGRACICVETKQMHFVLYLLLSRFMLRSSVLANCSTLYQQKWRVVDHTA
eukprot:gb/GECG01006223.1/.p1 GENE.gb/GECG01006223.1/~~gb/GECG01006223.1/.p1  ORF type:complete len:110 (+),score=3.29 gb/GECG01006223.1/:1-330(+)